MTNVCPREDHQVHKLEFGTVSPSSKERTEYIHSIPRTSLGLYVIIYWLGIEPRALQSYVAKDYTGQEFNPSHPDPWNRATIILSKLFYLCATGVRSGTLTDPEKSA